MILRHISMNAVLGVAKAYATGLSYKQAGRMHSVSEADAVRIVRFSGFQRTSSSQVFVPYLGDIARMSAPLRKPSEVAYRIGSTRKIAAKAINKSSIYRKMVADYRGGYGLKEIELKYGISWETARRWLHGNGEHVRPKGLPPNLSGPEIEGLVRMRQSGASFNELASVFGMSHQSMRNYYNRFAPSPPGNPLYPNIHFVFKMRDHGKTHREIAEKFGTSESTVRRFLRKHGKR